MNRGNFDCNEASRNFGRGLFAVGFLNCSVWLDIVAVHRERGK